MEASLQLQVVLFFWKFLPFSKCLCQMEWTDASKDLTDLGNIPFRVSTLHRKTITPNGCHQMELTRYCSDDSSQPLELGWKAWLIKKNLWARHLWSQACNYPVEYLQAGKRPLRFWLISCRGCSSPTQTANFSWPAWLFTLRKSTLEMEKGYRCAARSKQHKRKPHSPTM